MSSSAILTYHRLFVVSFWTVLKWNYLYTSNYDKKHHRRDSFVRDIFAPQTFSSSTICKCHHMFFLCRCSSCVCSFSFFQSRVNRCWLTFVMDAMHISLLRFSLLQLIVSAKLTRDHTCKLIIDGVRHCLYSPSYIMFTKYRIWFFF